MRSELQNKSILEQLNGNPLPASLKVQASDSSDLPQIEKEVMGTTGGANAHPISPAISNPFNRQQEAQKIAKVTSALKIVLTVIMALLIVASLMLIATRSGSRSSPAPRGRGDEAGRRDPLVHPLAVPDRGRRGRLHGRAGRHTYPVDRQDHDRRPAQQQQPGRLRLGPAQQHPRLPGADGDPLRAAILVSTIGSGVTLRRFLRV